MNALGAVTRTVSPLGMVDISGLGWLERNRMLFINNPMFTIVIDYSLS